MHLILPQTPGLERSAEPLVGAAPLLVGAAFLAELLSDVCYAELLGRSVAAATRMGTTVRSRRHRGLRPWFMLRLTVCGYGVAHVLPGGGATAATVTYGALRARGVDHGAFGLALAAVIALVYGALGVLFSRSLLYVFVRGDLTPAETLLALTAAGLLAVASLAGYAIYTRPRVARRALGGVIYGAVRVVRRRYGKGEAKNLVDRFAECLGEESRSLRRQISARPLDVLERCCLASSYRVFDALCLVLVFLALGVPAGTGELLVAYGIATAAGALLLTPGGIGGFEVTMLAALAVFGVGAAIPVLGYRLFNFWLPTPLATLFYPSLRKAGRGGL